LAHAVIVSLAGEREGVMTLVGRPRGAERLVVLRRLPARFERPG
jgi:hypothetical protein